MRSLADLIHQPLPAASLVLDDGLQPLDGAGLEQAIAALCARLSAHPCRQWLLACQQTAPFVVALLACWRCGLAVVLPNNHQAETLQAAADRGLGILADGDSDSVLPTITAGQATEGAAPLLLWTSGSSGSPKPVTKTLAQLQAEVTELERCFGPRLGACGVVTTVPPHHIYGLLFRILWPLASGRTLLGPTLRYPETLAVWLAQDPKAVLISSPAFLQQLLAAHSHHQLPPVHHCISSGGALAEATAQAATAAWGEAPIEVYGSTETGGIGWRQQHLSQQWQPFAPIQWQLDPERATLMIRSPYLASDQWWSTDDLAQASGDRFMLLGRADRIVKIAEKRVSLDQLEQRLSGHPWVSDCGLVLLEGERTTLGAVVVLTPEGEDFLATAGKLALNQLLRRHLLASHEAVTLPRRWRYPAALPRSSQGKLPRARLQELFA